MNPANPAVSTPKRKRSRPPTAEEQRSPSLIDDLSTSDTIQDVEGESGSPRTQVAYRFQGLDLEGAPITKLDLKGFSQNMSAIEDGNPLRKRLKILEGDKLEIPETPQGLDSSFGSEGDGLPPQKFEGSLLRNDEPGPVVFKGLGDSPKSSTSKLQRAYPSINRLADSKSRGRKRLGSPPLLGTVDTSLLYPDDTVVDPDRAALTWHDDEITGHDPSDPEDDGEGINGIGFKPTPAEARARTERRRQQMAEYKSREMKEARARRSERRRGGASITTDSKEEAARRVRFSEAEANIMITTI